MHLNRSRVKISANGEKNKKRKSVKSDISPIVKPKIKNKKLKIFKSPLKEKKGKNDKNKYKILSEWGNLLGGHAAFVLGNAPGIEKQNLSLLDGHFTIGINRIFYIYDPTILLWQDRQVWNNDKKTVLKQKAIKVCGSKSDPRNYFLNFRVKTGPYAFGLDPSVLHGTGNTTALAVQFAVALGCSNIVLLGTDCKYGSHGKTDFYGKNKDHKPYTLKMCNGAMKWLKDSCPVTIYNCSGNKLWDTQKLKNVIKKIQPPKIDRETYRKVFIK
jgi:hypothetical protein